MTYEELRAEFDNPSFRKIIKDSLSDTCCNCGTKENIEYHHVVPLILGGMNNISNIVALCHKCHKAAHHGHHISHYADHGNAGRKSKSSIEKNSGAFDMYINGEIGNRKCQDLLGYSQRSPISNRAEFRRYIKSKGILRVRNIIDVVATCRKNGLVDGAEVGEIVYADGRVEPIFYKDTGANDIDYERRKSRRAYYDVREFRS